MKITINEKIYDFTHDLLSVNALIEELKLDPLKIAVERNLEIVPSSKYAENVLQEGDNIEILQFIGGG